MKKVNKILIESGILLAAIKLKTKSAGQSLKDYFYEEETLSHISLVLYDLLPLSFKIGMRYQKFHEIFEKNFKGIRNALCGEPGLKEELSKTKVSKEKIAIKRKKPIKKSIPTKAKRVTKNEE